MKRDDTRQESTVLRRVPRFARAHERGVPRADGEGEQPVGAEGTRSAAKSFRRAELTRWLVDQHGLNPEHAEAVSRRLLSSAPKIRGAFLRWWLTGRVERLEVAGYSLRRLVDEKGMSPLGALLALSLLEGEAGISAREMDDRPRGEIHPEEALERAGG